MCSGQGYLLDMKNLLAFLLLCFKVLGESSTDEPLEVRAFVGLDVVLPCKQHLPKDTEVPTVEWSKPDLKPSPYVFVYRQNFEVYDEKHPDYESRTHLFMKQVQYGNFSMRLSNVRKEDAGIYICKTIWNPNRQDDVKLKLVVDVIPEPKMSVVLLENEQVTLSCEVSVCSLETHLMFWDGQENALEVHESKRSPGISTGCFTMAQRVTARTSAKSVICRVMFVEINQSRETHLLIPAENKESCAMSAGILTAVFLLILLGVVLVVVFKKKCCGSAKEKKVTRQSSGDSSSSNESEDKKLLPKRPDGSVTVEIPESCETQSNTLTQEPDLISCTSISVVSKADGKASSLFSLFPDNNANSTSDDAELKTCERTELPNTVKFKNKNKKLPRQKVTINCTSVEKLANLPSVLANNIAPPERKCITRSLSVSEADPPPASEEKHQRRRHSVHSVFSRSQKFEQLQEEQEQD